MKAEKNFNKCSFNKKWALLGGFIVLFFLIGAENANALPSCVDYKNSSWCGDSYCDPGLYCTGDNIMCDDYYGCVCNVECVNNCCLGNYCRPQCSTKKDTSWCGDGYCDPGTYCCGNNTMCSDGKNCDCDKECINNSCLDGVCRKCYYKDTDGLTYNETCVSKAGTFKDYCDGNTKVTYWCTASETCGKHTTACAAGETCQVQSNGEPKCIVACKSQGTACSATSECCTGLTCKDGYCCNQACTGTCTHCNATPGTCTYITAGTDPDEECTGTGTCGGTCNGSGACQYPSTSVTCSSLQDCDYLNYYYQSGTESPTATEYCYYRDYDDRYQYCDGAGSCASLNCNVYSDSLQYSCGTCKYISSSNCTGGTQGSCTNYSKGTSCGTNKECDGSGNCVTCYYPTGSTSASKTTVNTGETFTITVAGHDDDHDVWQLTYNKDSNVWNATNEQTCLLQQYDCTKSWSITESTAGTYTYYGRVRDSDDVHGCSSWHEAGAGSATVTVTPAAVPPTARTDPATNVEETSATLNGCVTATGGADYRVRFVWGDTSSYGSASGWTVYYSSPTCFIYDLTGLTKGKTYHFRIEAENSAGTGYGSDAVFTTNLTLLQVSQPLLVAQVKLIYLGPRVPEPITQ